MASSAKCAPAGGILGRGEHRILGHSAPTAFAPTAGRICAFWTRASARACSTRANVAAQIAVVLHCLADERAVSSGSLNTVHHGRSAMLAVSWVGGLVPVAGRGGHDRALVVGPHEAAGAEKHHRRREERSPHDSPWAATAGAPWSTVGVGAAPFLPPTNRPTTTKSTGTMKTPRRGHQRHPGDRPRCPGSAATPRPRRRPSRAGTQPRMKAKEVMRIGRSRSFAPSSAASTSGLPLRRAASWRTRR